MRAENPGTAASGTPLVARVASGATAPREEMGALDWARAMESATRTRQVAVHASPAVAPLEAHGVAYAGWALAFAFFLLLVATQLKERGNGRQLSLHGDAPELFLIPKALLARRPRR